MQRVRIGIDVGGTGIKGAAVDIGDGRLVTSRHKVLTPSGGRPGDIAQEVAGMVRAIETELRDSEMPASDSAAPVGVALPGALRRGIMLSAANLDPSWIGEDASAHLSAATGRPCAMVNDADAAGIAELAFGAARGARGTTLVLTFGTGIGTALFTDEVLVPNLELGHLELDGHPDYERYASPKTIHGEGISIGEWAQRAARFVSHLELLIHPDLIVVGGSISKEASAFLPFAGVSTTTVPATFRNNAGIIGAARIASS